MISLVERIICVSNESITEVRYFMEEISRLFETSPEDMLGYNTFNERMKVISPLIEAHAKFIEDNMNSIDSPKYEEAFKLLTFCLDSIKECLIAFIIKTVEISNEKMKKIIEEKIINIFSQVNEYSSIIYTTIDLYRLGFKQRKIN